MKKKFVVFGNCQSRGIAKLMLQSPSFASQYEHIPTRPVQTMRVQHLEDWRNAISQSDLIIYQKISENYRVPEFSESNMFKYIKPEALKISFPSLYFNAYFPQLGPHIANPQKKLSLLSQMDDYLWLGLYAKDISPPQAREIVIRKDLFSEAESQSFYETSILELQKRESSLDIRASDLYRSLYQKHRLGHQFNHPTQILQIPIVNRILSVLQEDILPEKLDEKLTLKSVGRLVSVGIYPSLYQGLGLEFEEDCELYNTLEGPHSLSFLLEKMWNFYEENYTKDKILKSIQAKKPWILSKLASLEL